MFKSKKSISVPKKKTTVLETIKLSCARKNPVVQKARTLTSVWKPPSSVHPKPITPKIQLEREMYLQTKGYSANVEIDTEYQPLENKPTLPISVQIGSAGQARFYNHPDNPNIPLLDGAVFSFNNVIGDYLQDEMGYKVENTVTNGKAKYNLIIVFNMFYAIKDIEFSYKDRAFYHDHVLPLLDRKRRVRAVKKLPTGISVWLPDRSGSVRLFDVSLEIKDISATQGVGSLKNYAQNVGIKMESKEVYTKDQKGRMLEMQLANPALFEEYGKGDCSVIIPTSNKNVGTFNVIAKKLGIAPNAEFGLSLGKICASMLAAWLEKELSLVHGSLSKLVSLAGANGILTKAAMLKLKKLNYTAMTDGGRCVKERAHIRHLEGLLFDIDIKGCYGDGIKNQVFAVGNPFLLTEDMFLGDYLNEYGKELVDGLWLARVRTDVTMPFEQDLLISKEEKPFKKWSLEIDSEDKNPDFDPTAHSIDASMIMAFKKITSAALTSDLLEVIQNNFSKDERGWLYANLIVESALIYRASDRVEKVTEEMAESVTAGKKSGVQIAGSFQWVGVPLSGYITPLIEMRKAAQLRDGKKSPMDVFTKVIINSTYGVICSAFFSDPGVSNVVVSSNITARARVLAWCMAKGLHLVGTITDGGVGDMSKVLYWNTSSAQGFADATRDIFKDKHRKVRCTVAPLYDVAEWNADMKEGSPEMDRHDAHAWAHLKKLFPNLSIFKYDQFRFETKSMWQEITLHQKANYELVNGSKVVRKYRGLVSSKVDTVGKSVFEAVREDKPMVIPVTVQRQIGLSEYQQSPESKLPYYPGKLLPGDTRTFTSYQYSHNPMSCTQYESVEHHAKVTKRKMSLTDGHKKLDVNDADALKSMALEMSVLDTTP